MRRIIEEENIREKSPVSAGGKKFRTISSGFVRNYSYYTLSLRTVQFTFYFRFALDFKSTLCRLKLLLSFLSDGRSIGAQKTAQETV